MNVGLHVSATLPIKATILQLSHTWWDVWCKKDPSFPPQKWRPQNAKALPPMFSPVAIATEGLPGQPSAAQSPLMLLSFWGQRLPWQPPSRSSPPPAYSCIPSACSSARRRGFPLPWQLCGRKRMARGQGGGGVVG